VTEVNRHISYYERYGTKYIGAISLNNVDLNDLLSLVTIEKYKDDYLLYNCYLLDKTMLDKIAKLDNQVFTLDLDTYEYFLEATAK
jgi:hypothetical protein